VIVTFLSDYGLEDEFVGVCHAVIAGIAPEARIIDLSHGVGRHGVLEGAVVLRNALPYLPAGVHLAVVDPGVGGERRAVAIRAADDRVFVGPDNGLLAPAVEVAGGAVEAVDVATSPFRLEPVSSTFHGRDLFAPVAARLAAGAALAEAGTPVAVDELTPLDIPAPRRADRVTYVTAVGVDRYGNVQLDVDHATLTGAGLRIGTELAVDGRPARYARTFADVAEGTMLVYEDAWRRLALAINRGDAAAELGVRPGDTVRIDTVRVAQP
jgi:S-adenosyl-L-methionine hydrolase (adenosine-forming)